MLLCLCLHFRYTITFGRGVCRRLCYFEFRSGILSILASTVWIKYSSNECCLNLKWKDLLLFCVIVFVLHIFNLHFDAYDDYKSIFCLLIIHCASSRHLCTMLLNLAGILLIIPLKFTSLLNIIQIQCGNYVHTSASLNVWLFNYTWPWYKTLVTCNTQRASILSICYSNRRNDTVKVVIVFALSKLLVLNSINIRTL